MRIKHVLETIVWASVIFLVGSNYRFLCSSPKPENFIQGKVISEYGNIARIMESSGALFGNESIKLGNPNYGLKVAVQEGIHKRIYIIEVDVGDKSGSSGPHTAYNLAAAIEKGTRIRFPLQYGGKNLFSADRVGIVDPDDIEIQRVQHW